MNTTRKQAWKPRSGLPSVPPTSPPAGMPVEPCAWPASGPASDDASPPPEDEVPPAEEHVPPPEDHSPRPYGHGSRPDDRSAPTAEPSGPVTGPVPGTVRHPSAWPSGGGDSGARPEARTGPEREPAPEAPPSAPAGDRETERLARVALTRLVEPGDEVAGRWLRTHGAVTLLRWITGDAPPPTPEAEPRLARYRRRLGGPEARQDLAAAEAVGARFVCPGDVIFCGRTLCCTRECCD